MENKSLDWDGLIHYGQHLFLPRNSILFRQGDLGTGFYYLKDGEVKISLVNYNGDERMIDYSGSGEIIGEHGIHESPYITTAETIKDSTLYYFPSKSLQELCIKVPEVADELSLSLTTKIRMIMNIKSLLNAPVEVQLAYFFYRFYEKTGNNQISLNRTTISSFVGTSRVTVWKILKEWEMENIIKITDRIIYLTDLQKIKQGLNHFIH